MISELDDRDTKIKSAQMVAADAAEPTPTRASSACADDPAPTSAAAASKDTLPVARTRMDRWKREEPALVHAWQQENSDAALTVLLKRYRTLINSQINKILAGRSVSASHRADLEQEANLAFVQAVNRFDLDAGTPLSSLATKYIRTALLRYTLDFRNSYRIGTGSDERKAYYAALGRRARRIHAGESEVLTEKDVEEIQKETGASMKSTKRAVDAIYAHSCTMDAAMDVEAESNEQIRSEDELSITRAMDILQPFIAELDERKSAIFAQFAKYGEVDGHELASRFDITPERIGQIRREMLGEMAAFLRENGIDAADLF